MIGPILLLAVLTFLNAAFASAEIAVISMSDTKLKKMTQDGDKRARKLTILTEQPARFLATIQVAITMSGFLSSASAADNFAGPLSDALLRAGVAIPEQVLKTVVVFLITLVLAYFNLVFGELVPKRIAMKKADQLALGMAGMLYGVSKIFAPLVFLLTKSTNLILRLIGLNPDENEEQVSEEEILLMLAEGKEQGVIDSHENEMIQNVFEFDDIQIEQICTHRLEADTLKLSDTPDAWAKTILETRHTYYPIYNENQDDVIGVLDTREYFRLKEKTKEQIFKSAVDKPYFVPENMKANVLFQNMKESRKYFAVLVDEYGGMTGIITVHDLIEELVGELYDEDETEEPDEIVRIGENCWNILGSALLEDVEEKLHVKLPTDMYDTFSGFVCDVIGRVPDDGERFNCEYQNLKIEVHSVENHRVKESTLTVAEETKE